jgi:carboxyl-terminal processing protease
VLPNGQFAPDEEEESDSLETEAERRSRPQFRSASGRIVYGGGAITPDVLQRPRTMRVS